MSDNLTVAAGQYSGVVATDDVSSVHYQVVKLAHGVADTATWVSTTNPLPVMLQGVAAADIAKAQDSAAGSTDTGVGILCEVKASLAAITPIDGDYARPRIDAYGAAWVIPNGGSTSCAPQTTGGLSKYKILSAATNNAANIKASAGQVYGYWVMNTGATTRFLKLYNNAGTPAPASDTVFLTVPLPQNVAVVFDTSIGIAMGTGIGIAIVANVGDTDNTAISANEIVGFVTYK